VQLLISDANILIDLEEGQLIELTFQLPYQFTIPDILFVEELEAEHQYLLGKGLSLSELSGETMSYAMELIPRYTKASRNDCFALALAAQEQCTLLTGDRALRNAAETESVMVRGTLWLVELMVRQRLITIEQAREAYQRMQEAGRRLPWGIAEAILSELEKEV
jgi:predicted nucleic acid-binding protein